MGCVACSSSNNSSSSRMACFENTLKFTVGVAAGFESELRGSGFQDDLNARDRAVLGVVDEAAHAAKNSREQGAGKK